jgi:hypothetical protein
VAQLVSQAENESRNAAENVRATFDGTTRDVTDLIASAAMGLSQTSDEMRTSARAMVEEMEAARSELKRGVFDLPREVQENTDQMRRQVTDQIKALNELSEIVTRHGSHLDVSSPRIAEARPAVRDTAPAQPIRRQASTAQPQIAELTRDRTEVVTPRSPNHIMETLNATAVDIVRALNDGSYGELYDRYSRGERDIFVRRLYARRDNGVIDDVRNRYRSDRDLRDAVDRYVAEFERLLSEIAAQDQNGTLRQMYLTSEPSKVFAMLAEATGHRN